MLMTSHFVFTGGLTEIVVVQGRRIYHQKRHFASQTGTTAKLNPFECTEGLFHVFLVRILVSKQALTT